MKKLLLFAIVILGFSAASYAQPGLTVNATSSAKIIAPLVITNDGDQSGINFGTIARGTTPGTVTIAGDAGGTRTGSNVTLSAFDDGHSAKFNITGEGTSTFAITLPLTDEVVHSTDASATMALSNFRSNITPTSNTGTGTLSDGSLIIYVGATLAVDDEQVLGQYNGNFTVTVNYN